jgi:hypothetical protein
MGRRYGDGASRPFTLKRKMKKKKNKKRKHWVKMTQEEWEKSKEIYLGEGERRGREEIKTEIRDILGL